MTDQERLEIMLEYVAGTLDAPQTESVRQALFRNDPQWSAALAEAEATLTAYAAAITPMDVPTSVKADLMRRVARGQTAARADSPDEFFTIRRLAQGFAAVAAIILLGVLVNAWTIRQVEIARKKVLADTSKDLMESQARIMALTDRINRDAKVMEALHSTNLKIVELGSDKTKAIGRILIDDNNATWQVFTTALSPLPSDKAYELWFITPDGKKLPGPMFNVDAKGEAMLAVDVPKNIGPVAVAAVTDEPAAGVKEPTGSIQLVGKLQ